MIFGWASPYFGHHLPGFETSTLIYAVAVDALLLFSLFVLGGAFWDKLRSLFQHNSYAIFPDKLATDGEPDTCADPDPDGQPAALAMAVSAAQDAHALGIDDQYAIQVRIDQSLIGRFGCGFRCPLLVHNPYWNASTPVQ